MKSGAPESLPRVMVDAEVIANSPLCREHFRIDLRVYAFPQTEPGEFVQLAARSDGEEFDEESNVGASFDGASFTKKSVTAGSLAGEKCSTSSGRMHHWGDDGEAMTWPTLSDPDLRGRQAMLRRPFSLAGRTDNSDGVVLSIIYRTVGTATYWLARRRVGDAVSVLGPMGNRFPKPAGGNAIFIGGGVGIPPLLYLADRWSAGQNAVRLLAICGATSRDLLPLTVVELPNVEARELKPTTPAWGVAEFSRCNVKSILATDDGSCGFAGLVTGALEQYLNRADDIHDAESGAKPVLYTCGPEAMMKRVAAIALERNLECYVAVERAMACGMATCQSCVIRVRSQNGWRYALSCIEGPIFRASELLW